MTWTFLSNHAHVLVCPAQDAGARLRDIAADVGVTERAVQRILSELEEADVIHRKDGRRNHYEINQQAHLRHPLEGARTISALLAMALGKPGPNKTSKAEAS